MKKKRNRRIESEADNSESTEEVLAPDDEVDAAVDEGMIKLIAVLNEVSKRAFPIARKVPEGMTDPRALMAGLALLTQHLLHRIQAKLDTPGLDYDAVADYMALLLPLFQQISPYVTNLIKSSAFEESLPDGVTVH